MRARTQRLIAVGISLVAGMLFVSPGVAQARWTGSDYCAVQNDKGDWSLVGGASCNLNPARSENASWSQALILDFDAYTVTNAYDPAEVESFDSLYAMLADLSENHASEGWMYVANSLGHSGKYVYLMVNRASCAGNSEWSVAPACDSPLDSSASSASTSSSTSSAPAAEAVPVTPALAG